MASAKVSPSRSASACASSKLLQRALKALAVDLDPLAAQQHQRLGAGEQRRDLLGGERLAVQRHVHVEIEQTVEARFRTAGARRPSP